MTAAHQERPLSSDKYYIPGSILRMAVDTTQPIAWGTSSNLDVYFDASPVFRLTPEGIAKGQIKPISWFSGAKYRRSGWAWGETYLKDGVTAFTAPIGAGKLVAFGPEITFRGQTHGTFKFLVNELYSME